MDYCSECTYLNPGNSKGDSKGYFYCERRDTYVLATTEHCYDYCRAYSRPDWCIKDLENRSVREQNGYDNPGCYITTVVCDVLGFEDNCVVLSDIRELREKYLSKNEKYKRLLVEYDILGPLIANSIACSPKKFEISKTIYDEVLVDAAKLINEKQYEKATNLYFGMTKGLLVGFGYGNEKVDEETIKNSDISTAGHGKQKSYGIIN